MNKTIKRHEIRQKLTKINSNTRIPTETFTSLLCAFSSLSSLPRPHLKPISYKTKNLPFIIHRSIAYKILTRSVLIFAVSALVAPMTFGSCLNEFEHHYYGFSRKHEFIYIF